jgi:hypothetical protein
MKQRILARRSALIAASLTAGCHGATNDQLLVCLSPMLVETDAAAPEVVDAGAQNTPQVAMPVA